MRFALLALLALAAPAHAEPARVKSTTLTLGRVKAKPARLLAKKIEVDPVRTLTPCQLKLVVDTQHPLFKRFTIEVGYQANASGAIENSRGGTSAEIVTAGSATPIKSTRGQLVVTRKKSHDFDAKLDVTFEHNSTPWTLSGTVRVENAACLWDVE